jgi:hypothetical protein
MGLFWRLFAPKPFKKARRSVRRATHPVHYAVRAATPKPVKRLQRAAHPVELAELKIQDAAVDALRGRRGHQQPRQPGRSTKKAPDPSGRDERGQGKLEEGRGDERPDWMRDGIEFALLNGSNYLAVVGEGYYQENLWRLVGPHPRDEQVRCNVSAVLVAEDDNPYDDNAVAVWVQGLKVGYLARGNAGRYRPGLLSLQRRYGQHIALTGVIAGGGIHGDSPGQLGIFLRHDPADFGL